MRTDKQNAFGLQPFFFEQQTGEKFPCHLSDIYHFNYGNIVGHEKAAWILSGLPNGSSSIRCDLFGRIWLCANAPLRHRDDLVEAWEIRKRLRHFAHTKGDSGPLCLSWNPRGESGRTAIRQRSVCADHKAWLPAWQRQIFCCPKSFFSVFFLRIPVTNS